MQNLSGWPWSFPVTAALKKCDVKATVISLQRHVVIRRYQQPSSLLNFNCLLFIIIIIIIIIIKKSWQCNAERERYTPYQSEDPAPQ